MASSDKRSARSVMRLSPGDNVAVALRPLKSGETVVLDDIAITIVAFGDPTPDTLHAYRELGVKRGVLGAARTGWADPATTMPFVERYTSHIAELA